MENGALLFSGTVLWHGTKSVKRNTILNFRFSGFRLFLDNFLFKDYFLDLNKTRIYCASKRNKLILIHCDEKDFRNKKLDGK